ncbi:Leucine-rich repeat - like 10, partial [Theobroma cacao]
MAAECKPPQLRTFYANDAEYEAFERSKLRGHMRQYTTTLDLVRSIDFSYNSLSGEIPTEVTSLLKLQALNLSHNLFTGPIPKNIGVMRLLESVDFSVNELSGPVPESMSTLTFLSYLNLSYNNLIGQIPLSTQLQSLDSSSYVGNQLCGSPLPDRCSANGTTDGVGNGSGENDNGFETVWFCLGMAYGFAVGFWSVFGLLVFGPFNISNKFRKLTTPVMLHLQKLRIM